MTRSLTPAERLATAEKDVLLDDIVKQSTWDRFLVEQAVFAYGLVNDTFSANCLRDVLPEMGHGFLGAAINSLRTGGIIRHTGQMVPSTSGPTHGHRIAVWQITDKGRAIAAARRPQTRERAA
ncbi:hypothetical protein [Streptomyces sp. SAJ15]|uniref:hypothetical protein n=1 Tax=Streptomyces sp. SAJ15 TaxID=2011095 RepID=UPI0011850E6C|nr:hypothetical protein [Streptomyces sp. SAJ15]TVL89818.1 hypothetical protein CD790_25835 [Streptomyces sp. SAJ15]